MRLRARHGLAVGAATAALPVALASSAAAAPAPACDPSTYPVPFLKFYGGIANSTTRFVELQIRPARKEDSDLDAWADVEYPFSVTVTRSDGFSRTFNVTNYARQHFPARFANRSQTNQVTTTYTEIHTAYPVFPGVPVNTRCSRTLSATYKAPPKEKKPPRRTGGRGRNGGGRTDDPED